MPIDSMCTLEPHCQPLDRMTFFADVAWKLAWKVRDHDVKELDSISICVKARGTNARVIIGGVGRVVATYCFGL